MRRPFRTVLACLGLAVLTPVRPIAAAENWFEIKSPNFTVWTNANNGDTRTVVWQLEQIRNVAKNLWPWMKVDLPKPLIVIAVKDEQSMKALAPSYWEAKGGVRPGSVWVSAADANYIAIRTDMRQRDDGMVNPHSSAYFSYAHLAFNSSFSGPVPMWLSRGLAGVMSNTLVRDKDVVIGAVIPWHLERLRERRVPLRQMLAITRTSPEFRSENGLLYFDAQSWAFVHYLMFGEKGVHAPKLNAFVAAVERGDAPDAAFAAAIGNIEDYDREFATYVNRQLFSAARVNVDLGVDRERFPARPMTVPEAAIARASFHAAMGRTAEARALIDEASKADPNSAAVHAIEGLLLDRGGNAEAAKAAYIRAAELGTSNTYALYRSAVLEWNGADAEAMGRVEKRLSRAVELNPNFAAAHASLAEARALLKHPQSTIAPSMQKAVSLEPSNPWHRLAAARVMLRLNVRDEARKAAEGALKLADDDPRARQEAERLLSILRNQ